MTKFCEKTFTADTPKGALTFNCWTTHTRNGFCHTCYCVETGQTTKMSYINRTWERYQYQTVLIKAANKLNKEQREFCQKWANENYL